MSKSSTRPRYYSVQSIRLGNGHSLPGKDILVFCDGTGKDGRLTKDGKIGSSGKGQPTNIWQLYQLALLPETVISGGRQREIVYISGVGSGSTKNLMNILCQIFGATIVDNIITAYLHIAKHYEARDAIHLFGYSRGAFVARKVASLIYRIGIVRTEEELQKLWSRHERPVPWNLLNSEPRGIAIPIKSLVVWDTVGAIHAMPNQKKIESDILGMPDEELPPNVLHAFHVVAFHENRKRFRVTLFKPKSREESKKLKEVWFPGAHSDVGGGGSNKIGLPNISLVWVLGELETTCSLVVPPARLDYPVLHNLTPSDAYHESPPWKRMVDKCQTRISLLKPTTFVHETVLYLRNLISTTLDPRPKPLPHLLTVNDLSGIGWDIRTYVVARNKLENLKQAHALEQRRVKEQAAQYRSRITSMHIPGTPRPSGDTIVQSRNTPESIPRSRRSSVASQMHPEPAAPPRSVTHSPTVRTRSRAESHAIPRPRDITSEQPALRTTPTVALQNGRNEATSTSGTTSPRPPSTPTQTPASVRATSPRSRAGSYVAPPMRPTPPGPGQLASGWTLLEGNSKLPVPSTNLAPSRSGSSTPLYLPAHMNAPGTRLRSESYAGHRLPTIPSKQAVHHSTLVEVPQRDRNVMPPVDASSRSDVFEPRQPTVHVRTTSTRSRTESHAARRLRSPSPGEAAPIVPGAGSRLPSIPSGQDIRHPIPTVDSQHRRNAVSPVGVAPRSDLAEPRHPTTHVRTTSTRSRTESHTPRQLPSMFPIEATLPPSTITVPRYGGNETLLPASSSPLGGIIARDPNLPKPEQRAQSHRKDNQPRSERGKK